MVNQDRMAIVIPEVSGYIIPGIGLVWFLTPLSTIYQLYLWRSHNVV